MSLAAALGVGSPDEIDTSRPIQIGPLLLGIEAAAEAQQLLADPNLTPEIIWWPKAVAEASYWSINHQTAGSAELFSLPVAEAEPRVLPTAIEIAIVRAAASLPVENHNDLFNGGIEIALGPTQAWSTFRDLVSTIKRPLVGTSLLYMGSNQATIREDAGRWLSRTCLQCLANSFKTSPIKFRFLELYRMIEARFLADVKEKLLADFDAEPGGALRDASEALKSELAQIKGLAENQQAAFEACWATLKALDNNNRFATALFRRMKKREEDRGAKWQTGAALIYSIRCAVVHAGEKDMIFENYADGDHVIDSLMPDLERAALLLVGIELVL